MPIVVPEVDAVPVVRITWDPPAEDLDKTLEWYSKADIARNEGVSKTAVSNSIAAGLRRMKKALDNFI